MSLKELETRMKSMEDLEEIKKLHQYYIYLMDTLQFEKVLDLFTEDATAEVRKSGIKKGKKEISEMYLGARSKRTTRNDIHLAVHPDITVDGNTAQGHWQVYIFFSKPTIQWVQGRNDCEYKKENGKWKISKLKFTRTLASDPSLYP
jgi:ketosteroid isomerase-like protein